MTLDRLKGYTQVKREIREMRELAASYRDKAEAISQQYEGMPGGHTASDKIGKIVSIYTDLEHDALEKELCLAKIASEISTFINQIDDPETRRIFTLRFLRGMSWKRVAREIGTTEDSIKKKCYRYLDE